MGSCPGVLLLGARGNVRTPTPLTPTWAPLSSRLSSPDECWASGSQQGTLGVNEGFSVDPILIKCCFCTPVLVVMAFAWDAPPLVGIRQRH